MFQSNMTKSTLDGNCMAKKMLIVMLSTNPAIGEKNIPMNKKKITKNMLQSTLVNSTMHNSILSLNST